MDFGPPQLDPLNRWDRRWFAEQQVWIDEWNAANGPWADFDRAVALAGTEHPKYIPARAVGLLQSDVPRLAEYLNTMDELGYGIQRMPTEDFGYQGKTIWFIRKDDLPS